MIFKTHSDDFFSIESYKERNLYYKIFAGYILNEVVPGYNNRKGKFFDLFSAITKDTERYFDPNRQMLQIIDTIKNQEVSVTFDFHTAQVFKEDKRDDRGEMSDILLISDTCLVSIECKYGSDYDIEKDIDTVQGRIKKYAAAFNRRPMQVLLLKEIKWKRSRKIDSRLKADTTYCPIVVMFWEDLLSLIEDEDVKNYLIKQLQRKFS